MGFFTSDKKYASWQEAAHAAKKLGVVGSRDYKEKYTRDKRLPEHPHKIYPNFPGWTQFLA